MQNIEILNRILKNQGLCNSTAANKSNSICVFDLDSTLFNVSPRTQQIVHEFCEQHQIPELKQVQVQPHHWGLKESLMDSGIHLNMQDPVQLKLFEQLRDFWKEKFFSNEYLQYDTPYLGAVDFVQTLVENNIPIHYLTGRDVHRMGRGTKEVLLKWGFPILSEKDLHLKPHKDMDDRLFKMEWALNLKKNNPHSMIYFFENEPVNINAIAEQAPDIEIIYLDTTHSRQQQVQYPATTIQHFDLHLTEELI